MKACNFRFNKLYRYYLHLSTVTKLDNLFLTAATKSCSYILYSSCTTPFSDKNPNAVRMDYAKPTETLH